MIDIAQRLSTVQQRIRTALHAAGRPLDAVQLIVVSKRQPLAALCAAYDAGARHFGESYAQELANKATALARSGRHAATWHFIGQLQRNKMAQVVAHAAMIHSIDRLALLPRLLQLCPSGNMPKLLAQVSLAPAPQRGGVPLTDLSAFLGQWLQLAPQLPWQGLMALPPRAAPAKPYFLRLKALLLEQVAQHGCSAKELSMGMSHDYLDAIAAGATWVRLGQALFAQETTV